MNCLITGGAGFIGGHLSEALLRRGDVVAVIDNLSTGSLSNIERFLPNPAFTFVQDDVISSARLPELVEKADVVFHFAAVVGVDLVVREPVRTILTNVNGTERVLSLVSQFGKRVILASTSEVYGKSPKIPFNEKDDLIIGSSMNSRWSYACSKLLDEFLLMAYHRNHNLRGTVVRFFNTVGPRQTGKYGMVIPRFVASALRNEPVCVYGSGMQTRCFCHVFDTIRALNGIVARGDEGVGRIFNIGGTSVITILDLAKTVIRVLDSKSSIQMVPYNKAYEEGFEDMMHRKPDCTALSEFSGWTAELSLEQIIRDVAAAL